MTRPQGRRRHDLHRHPDRAVRPVPGDRRLQRRSTRCPRRSSTTPRPSARSRSATARSRPTEKFVPGQGITLTRYDEYAGDEKAKADTVEFRVYTDVSTAYTDAQGGNLDIVDNIPPDAIATAQGRVRRPLHRRPRRRQFTYLGFPTYDPRYADKRVRQAFSMAIDRKAITDAIFNGTRTPADSVIAPVVDGYRDDACKYCKLDVEKANAAARRGRLRPQQAGRAVVQRRRRSRRLDRGRGQPAPQEPRRRVRPAGQPGLRRVPAARVTRRASPGRSVSAGAWTTRARRTTSSRCTPRRRCRRPVRTTRSTATRSSTSWSPRATRPQPTTRRSSDYQEAEDILLEDMPVMPDVLRPGADRLVGEGRQRRRRHLRPRRRRQR